MAVAKLFPYHEPGNPDDIFFRGKIGNTGGAGVSKFWPIRLPGDPDSFLLRGMNCQGRIVYGFPFREGDDLLARTVHRVCGVPPLGWCCVNGVCQQMTAEACALAGGTFHLTQAECLAACEDEDPPVVPGMICAGYQARCRYRVTASGFVGDDCVANRDPARLGCDGVSVIIPGAARLNGGVWVYNVNVNFLPILPNYKTLTGGIPNACGPTPADPAFPRTYAQLFLSCSGTNKVVVSGIRFEYATPHTLFPNQAGYVLTVTNPAGTAKELVAGGSVSWEGAELQYVITGAQCAAGPNCGPTLPLGRITVSEL